MNLVIIAALVAVCGAAKLDRTYLPPASAKTAGGSPGSLQAPLQNSLNNGLGGLPKGSFTNDFEGVVVDAVNPGTRASGNEETGLGAPRISYGSTNSKVGSAAFKTNPNAYNSFEANQQSGNSPGSERPRAALDRSAAVVRFDSEVGSENYNYAFETDNGIVAEENGVAANGVQAQGGFSYTGDDGQVYTVTYTADEGGYQPKGAHLPTPPPIPEEILRSLEQNARDEAAGLMDDGSYDAQKYNAGSDYNESDDGKYNHQSTFGQNGDAAASGSFMNQYNQPIGQDNPASNQASFASAQAGNGQNAPSGNRFGSGSFNRFESQGQINQNIDTAFGFTGQGNGNSNEYLPPTTGFNQKGRPSKLQEPGSPSQDGEAEKTDLENASNAVALSQQNLAGESRPQFAVNSFGNPISSPNQPQIDASTSAQQPQFNRRPSNGASFSQAQASATFGNRNEYLPPSSFKQPSQSRPQGSAPQFNQQYNQAASFQAFQQASAGQSQPQGSFSSSAPSGFGSQATFGSQSSQQSNAFEGQSQPSGNGFSSFQAQSNAAQSQSMELESPKATAPPSIELTTPFESSNTDTSSQTDGQNMPEIPSFPSSGRPQFGNQFSAGLTTGSAQPTPSFGTQPSRRPLGSAQNQAPTFPAQESSPQFNQAAQQSANAFASFEPQYASTTQQPNYYQQPQGADDSYYYKQPSQPFNTPQGSRFPSAPSNQFNRVTPAQSNAQYSQAGQTAPSQVFQSQNTQFQGNNIRPPTVRPTAPSTQFSSGFTDITQASISPFPSQTPTQSPQFGSKYQTQSGSKFNYQNQYNQAPSTQTSKPAFGQQPAFGQNAFSQQGNRRPSFPAQPSSIKQEEEQELEDASPSVATQQYNGEIYEYNKPAQTLPPPEETMEPETLQFGQKLQPQISAPSNADDSQSSTSTQINQQIPQSRPQFGAQPSRPQTQTTQGQFGSRPSSSRPQFGQAQAQASFGSQTAQEEKQPMPFGQQSQPESQNLEIQEPKPSFGFGSPCCQNKRKPAQPGRPVGGFTQGQNAFGSQGFPSQSFKPEPTSAFAGKGEIFGGPRKPPSFDPETGYHY